LSLVLVAAKPVTPQVYVSLLVPLRSLSAAVYLPAPFCAWEMLVCGRNG